GPGALQDHDGWRRGDRGDHELLSGLPLVALRRPSLGDPAEPARTASGRRCPCRRFRLPHRGRGDRATRTPARGTRDRTRARPSATVGLRGAPDRLRLETPADRPPEPGRLTGVGRLLLVRHGESEGNRERRVTPHPWIPL